MGYLQRMRDKVQDLKDEIEEIENELKNYAWVKEAVKSISFTYSRIDKDVIEDIIEMALTYMEPMENKEEQ